MRISTIINGGKVMVTASLAINAARFGADELTDWFSLVAFYKGADALLRHRQGDLLAAMGVLSRRTYTDRNNVERESWSLNCDSIVSARTVRPGGRRSPKQADPAGQAPFDDEIPL